MFESRVEREWFQGEIAVKLITGKTKYHTQFIICLFLFIS